MYHNLLVRIKNAERARKKVFRAVFSNMDLEVAKVLVAHGYLKGAKKKTLDKKHFLEIELLPRSQGYVIHEVKFISTPGRRIYSNYKELRPVKQGYGLGVLSTPKGIVSVQEAKKQKVGGEYLFQIW